MFKCKLCDEKYNSYESLIDHIGDEHEDKIPKNFTVAQFEYALRTGKTEGRCVIDRRPTEWNEKTGKYHRFCKNPKCKETYRNIFKNRMIGKYGKVHLLSDPDKQREMLSKRSISGEYTWSDGKKIPYTGSYELDFLKFLDVFMDFDSDDIMSPSPHTYYYEYEGEKKFYIPDFFIPSLGLEIEIKDGGDNPNKHHKIQNVDKKKEQLKDAVIMSQNQFSYIKLTNKNYDPFFEFLYRLKQQYSEMNEKTDGSEPKFKPIFIVKNTFTDRRSAISDAEPVNENMLINQGKRAAKEIVNDFIRNTNNDFVMGVINGGEILSEYQRKQKEFVNKYKNNKDVLRHFETTLRGERAYALQHSKSPYSQEHVIFIDTELMPQVVNHQENMVEENYKVDESIFMEKTLEMALEYRTILLERMDSKEKRHPVFILLTYTNTNMAKLIRFFTGDPYSHASISFDSSMRDVYSFGRKYKDDKMTFINEDIQDGIFKDVSDHANYSLYVMFVNDDKYRLMKKRLEEFKKNANKLKFSFIGLFNIARGKETSRENEYFCSQFVAEIIKAGDPNLLKKDTSLYTPYDLSEIEDVHFVTRGKLKNYNKDLVDKKVKYIEKSIEALNSYDQAVRENFINRYSEIKKEMEQEVLRKFRSIPALPARFKNDPNPMVYFGLTEKEKELKEINYFITRRYSLKGVNLSLDGLIKFLKDNDLTDKIKYYSRIPVSKFYVDDSVEFDENYDMIAVLLPFRYKIDDIRKISY